MDMVQMYNPNLDNAQIDVAEWGVPLFEDAGWVLGAAPAPDQGAPADTGGATDADTASPSPSPSPQPGPGTTTSEAATAPDSDGGTTATTDTGTASGSDTEEEGTIP